MCYFDGHVRELGTISEDKIDRLRSKIERNPKLWDAEDSKKPNKFTAFRNTVEHIVFRFPLSLDSHLQYRDFAHWEEWKDVIEPIMQEATRYYGYENGKTTRIMLAKLLAGQTIEKHIDGQESARLPHKIHVPIVTSSGVEFWEEDAVYHFDVSRAYEVNNRILHGGTNKSTIDRIHLIFDYWNNVNPPSAQEP